MPHCHYLERIDSVYADTGGNSNGQPLPSEDMFPDGDYRSDPSECCGQPGVPRRFDAQRDGSCHVFIFTCTSVPLSCNNLFDDVAKNSHTYTSDRGTQDSFWHQHHRHHTETMTMLNIKNVLSTIVGVGNRTTPRVSAPCPTKTASLQCRRSSRLLSSPATLRLLRASGQTKEHTCKTFHCLCLKVMNYSYI